MGLGPTFAIDQSIRSFFSPTGHFSIAPRGLAPGLALLSGSFNRFSYRDKERSTDSNGSGLNRDYIAVPHSVLLNMIHGGMVTGESATRIPTVEQPVSGHQIGEGGRDDVDGIGGDGYSGDHGDGNGGDGGRDYDSDGKNDGGREDDGSDQGGTRGKDGEDSNDDDDERDDNESMDEVHENEGGDDGREDMEDASRNTTTTR